MNQEKSEVYHRLETVASENEEEGRGSGIIWYDQFNDLAFDMPEVAQKYFTASMFAKVRNSVCNKLLRVANHNVQRLHQHSVSTRSKWMYCCSAIFFVHSPPYAHVGIAAQSLVSRYLYVDTYAMRRQLKI